MVDALKEEWRQRPPVHHLVAAYLDYKPREATAVQSEANAAALLAEFGGNLPIVRAAPIDTSAFDAQQNEKRGSDV